MAFRVAFSDYQQSLDKLQKTPPTQENAVSSWSFKYSRQTV